MDEETTRRAVEDEKGEQPGGRLIALGPLRIHLDEEQETVAVLQSLVRRLSNQEAAEILGVSERTVRRWKNDGRLSCRGDGRLILADLLMALSSAPGGENG